VSVLIIGRAKVGIADAIIHGQILASTPFILREPLNRFLSKVSRQVELRLGEGDVITLQEIGPRLIKIIHSRIADSGRTHAGGRGNGRNRIIERAERALIRA
jgi:hypothetical protein